MEEEIQMYLDEAKSQMEKSIEHSITELGKIRAGKASPAMLDGLLVPYYGSNTPLNQVAGVTTPDARTISIKPFEKSIIVDIEKAIMNSDLGLNPSNNGESIMINIPALTEDRRKQLVKQAKQEIENGKVSIRNARKESNDSLRQLLKDGASEDAVKAAEESVQGFTNKYTADLEKLFVQKEIDILKV